jgi:septal ring factor EnvC (AmiA/AmiB activator)
VTDEEISNLRQSAREGWRYADELEQERKRLTGEAAVMRSLLRECDAVLSIIEPENDDEAQDLARLRQHIRMATGEEKGTLL